MEQYKQEEAFSDFGYKAESYFEYVAKLESTYRKLITT